MLEKGTQEILLPSDGDGPKEGDKDNASHLLSQSISVFYNTQTKRHEVAVKSPSQLWAGKNFNHGKKPESISTSLECQQDSKCLKSLGQEGLNFLEVSERSGY